MLCRVQLDAVRHGVPCSRQEAEHRERSTPYFVLLG